jgi:glucokinase
MDVTRPPFYRAGAMGDVASECVIGVDVGGTHVKAGAFDAGMRALATARRDTGDPGTLLERVAETVGELAADACEPAAVTVVFPGIVDEDAGVVRFAANLGWRDVPARERLEERIGRPVRLGHDVRAGALAEARLGAARGSEDFLFLALGTGIAGAVMTGGRLDTRPYAGEIGHLRVDPGGPECGCGAHGCLEAIASASAVARAYGKRTGADASAKEVARRAGAGDADAGAVWVAATDALGAALAACAAMLAPDVVVIGGGLSGAGDALLAPVDRALRARLSFQPAPELRVAELGDRAGSIGAGLLAWDAAGVIPRA